MHREKRPEDLAREAAGDPPEPRGTRGAAVGMVKWWRDRSMTGAITCDATAPWDIWCHWGAIEGGGLQSLTANLCAGPGGSVL